MNREKGEGVPDFVLMNEISENALWDNLKLRYSKDKVYTYIGEVVVSVNPYKKMDQIYNASKINEYRGRYMYEVPPHIYSLSNDVYRNMMQNHDNQCVIISGESGAGKTEASKIFMQYIAAVSKSSKEVDRVKNQLLDSNPLLEAFGNSKTLRNDNSSRFGKYMEIQFEHNGAPAGGKITNYLLEKSRVVIRAKGERSFHIFYQLLAGGTDQDLGKLLLQKDPKKYAYLNLSDCVKVDTINDANDFKVVSKAMDTLGFKAADKTNMWKIVSAILHLGNVTFEQNPSKTSQANIKNMDEVMNVAALLDVPSDMLAKVLTSRSITTGVGKRSSHINIPLDVNQAAFTRDALAKSVYERLFIWLVDFINTSLSCKNPDRKFVIGVLDIYGFEVFENNSFEQFCINLCNEKLQQLFIELTLKSEQEEYVREGIKWEPVKYFNNKIICDLIEGKIGIISLLDEACLIGESTDLTFLDKLNRNFGKHAHYESYVTKQDRKIPDHCFRLQHYAGDVTYNVTGFLEKNRDTLFGDLVSCLQSSDNSLVKSLYKEFDINSKKRPLTASTQFKNALQQLMDKLLACVPHYIRCIKPNDSKRSDLLDEARVRHQIRYLGLLENVRVRRAGFCYRQEYDRFVWRYKMISPATWPSNPGLKGPQIAQKIVDNQKISKDDYRMGKTKIFIRNPTTLFALEEARERAIPSVVTVLQKHWRGYMERSRWRLKKAAIKILLFLKRWKSRKWIVTVIRQFKNVATDPKLGKFIEWPTPPKVLEPALVLVKKIWANWRANKIVKALTPDQQEEMRQKIVAYDIFRSRKPWNFQRRYQADYLQMDTNPLKEKYLQGMQKLFATFGDTQVLFADYVDKVNSKAKVDRRAIVVTERSIYKQDPKNYKVKKCEVPLSQVTSIGLSPNNDCFVVVHAKEPYRDLVADFGVTGVEKYSEFVSLIVMEIKKLTDQMVPVDFGSNIKYNNGRTVKAPGTDCMLGFQFVADPKVTVPAFKSGKNNQHSIVIPKN